MKTLIGSWLLATLGATVLAKSREPDVRIEVFVYNYAGLAAKTLATAKEEAARIYMRVGIETQWLDCPLSPAEAAQYPACQVPVLPTRLALRILSGSMAERVKLSDATFGLALFPEDGGFGMTALVCSHCAEELAKGHKAKHAIILGHLMAHELGHLLLGVGSHSPTGLMHVPWSKKELESIAQGSLLFSSWEGHNMRCQVLVRLAKRVSGQASGQ
jgi:hypothetical protein